MQVIILTKSAKDNGYCVAGINTESCKFVRLVSWNGRTDALFSKHIKYANEQEVQVLDVVNVPIERAVSTKRQPENVLIKEGIAWDKTGQKTIEEVLELCCNNDREFEPFILGNTNYYLSEKDAAPDCSLVLVKVKNLKIYLNDRDKVKADFDYKGIPYQKFSVTDPHYFSEQNRGTISSAYCVISLPDKPFIAEFTEGKRYYKFIATIFPTFASTLLKAEQ